VVAEWVTRRRRNEKAGLTLSRTAPPGRLLSRLLTTRRGHLSKADALMVAAIETGVPALGVARDLMERFHRMLRAGDAGALMPWLADAGASPLASFGKASQPTWTLCEPP